MSAQFLPPQLNPLITRLLQIIAQPVAYWVYKFKLVVAEKDIAKIKAIANSRIVYLPNHSNLDDGIVLFLLSSRLGQLFHYIVAYEAFEGLVGKLLQWVGAYSIRRGMSDRHSISYTLNLLQKPACRLVVFPEGGCSYQNDTVMPFRQGAIELSFKAIAKLVKQNQTIPDFYLVPVSLKYRYPHDMTKEIASGLTKLETALEINPTTTDSYQRLRAIAEQVLINLETEYNLHCQTPENWNQRIANLKSQVLHQCQEQLGLTSTPQIPIRERVYKIQSLLISRELPAETKEALRLATFRLLNFDAIYDGYVAEKPTDERFLDTLTRLEREVFKLDRPQPKSCRQVYISLGDPVNLKQYWQAYQQERETTVKTLTTQLQQTVQAQLI